MWVRVMTDTLDCGHPPSEHESFTTGYGTDLAGKRHCYDCCAKQMKRDMILNGHAVLYDCDVELKDWPGKLVFKVIERRTSRHNLAGSRHDVWFTGPDGRRWHGVRCGNNTQIVHCKSTKG